MHSIRILCVVTLLVAFYTQTTSLTKCAFPAHVDNEYAEVFCSNHIFMYAEHKGDCGDVMRYHNDIKYQRDGPFNTKILLTFYSYFPLAFIIMAAICFMPQVLWKFMHLFGYGECFLARQIGCLLQSDESEEIQTCCKEMKGHHEFLKIFIGKIFSLIIAGVCLASLYLVLFNPEKINLFPLFQKEVLCSFRRAGQTGYITSRLSCIMPQNFYNEQVCIVLLAWFVIVTIANLLSLLSWIVFISPCYIIYVMSSLPGVVGFLMKLLYWHSSHNEILSFL